MKKIFNPLASVDVSKFTPRGKTNESSIGANVSTSKVVNEEPGVCPKCGKLMVDAIVEQDTVFYCDDHRIALPKPNKGK